MCGCFLVRTTPVAAYFDDNLSTNNNNNNSINMNVNCDICGTHCSSNTNLVSSPHPLLYIKNNLFLRMKTMKWIIIIIKY